MSLRNVTDTQLEKVIGANDRPHAFHLMGIVELPFGRNRALGAGWHRVVDGVLGGWQVGWTYLIQSGAPLSLAR